MPSLCSCLEKDKQLEEKANGQNTSLERLGRAAMFAYVKYTDGYKTVVPISHIKNFDPKTYQTDILYSILWEEDYFKGQVLLLKGMYVPQNFNLPLLRLASNR